MIDPKDSLKNLKRISPNRGSLKNSLNLDLNENIAGLPNDFIDEVCARISGKFLSSYPNFNWNFGIQKNGNTRKF